MVRFRSQLLVIGLVVLFVATWTSIQGFTSDADNADAAKYSVSSIATRFARIDAAEWRLIAGEDRWPVIRTLQEQRDGIKRDVRRVSEVVSSKGSVQLADAVDRYLNELDAEVAAISLGERDRARELGRLRVDPAHDRVSETLATVESELADRADAAAARAALFTALAIGGSLICAGATFGAIDRGHRRQAQIELEAASQRAEDARRTNEALGQARTDDLTGLMNRRGFTQTLEGALDELPNELSVLMVDLNGFKEVNDSLGHHAGDQLLSIVAQRFRRAVPLPAVLSRLGGDEFGLVVPGSPEDAGLAADALLASLTDPVRLDDMTVRIGASVGIAQSPRDGVTHSGLLRAADVAMYDAKKNHLGASWYSLDRDPHSRGQLALIEDLRTAIDRRSFEMHYQPTISVETGEVIGMEALIRWNHPTRGDLTPDEFIPLAERVGLIPAITRAVLDLSIAHVAETRRRGYDLGLSVNISALDLVDESLPDYVEATLAANDVPARCLTLEITETALSSDSVRAERTLIALRKLGVRISIDDFGVGYSSMSQLLKLPLDELKIDRSFIANLAHDVRAQAILSATIELGRTLDLDIVAEGIENAAALDEVAERGVGVAQGYFFSKGLDPADFEAFLVSMGQRPKLGVDTVPTV